MGLGVQVGQFHFLIPLILLLCLASCEIGSLAPRDFGVFIEENFREPLVKQVEKQQYNC